MAGFQTVSPVGQLAAPGRLGDPTMVLKTDPRADPRMVAALGEFGLSQAPPPAPVTAASPRQQILEYCAALEGAFEQMFDVWFSGLPEIDHVERRTEVIKGVDDNDITLYVHRPTNVSGLLPCVYHIH